MRCRKNPGWSPGIPIRGDDGFTTTLLGNLSAVAKAVVWEDRQSGSLLSGGATLSFPTASNLKIDPGMSTVAFMQPFGEYEIAEYLGKSTLGITPALDR